MTETPVVLSNVSLVDRKESFLDPITPSTTDDNLSPPRCLDWDPRRSAMLKIIGMCAFVTLPVILFTVIILWLVLSYEINATHCPYAELCPNNGTFEDALASSYYYVDYPAARLAFVSSWSSTVSLSLLGFITAIYSYFVASRLIKLSVSRDTAAGAPTPYQTSILLRLLNAELMVLLHLLWSMLKEVFWARKRAHRSLELPSIVRLSIVILVVGLTASVFIQAADTYLHIAMEAVELTRIEAQSNTVYELSRGIAPWCLDRPTTGYIDNALFWGCSEKIDDDGQIRQRNYTQRAALILGTSPEHNILDYSDADGVPYAIVGPKDVSASTDWQATTFAVSLQCDALRNDSCAFQGQFDSDLGTAANFSCTQGSDLSGTLYNIQSQTYSPDFHRYVLEPTPFEGVKNTVFVDQDLLDLAANLTHDETADLFRNPWHFTAAANLFGDTYSKVDPNQTNDYILQVLGVNFLMYNCNASVWDLNYTVVASQVTSITKRRSNSTTAGIVSMPTAQMWGDTADFTNNVIGGVNALAQSGDEFTKYYMREMARGYSVALATQLSARPALSVQARSSKIVSKVPKAALWLLITANLVFAIVAVGLSALAISVASSDVHQLRMRMNVAGLTSHLFEGEHAEKKVRDEEDLFEEHGGDRDEVRRVGVSRTATGGVRFDVFTG
ncbi:hypothetical protein K491DRAFT_776247 [Lophiostoma macrostomum CBS 122681]|uniref:Uncharacterized protein n=1 Tax=Lophiostoma macrostomum CBS 122681 TaxID=1314788 RepID=A0A6A6THN8_9PLEO|nr:hypothetical protein K491DRAFT_776247 [Lophiostoma macrostomum CBS 122681]